MATATQPSAGGGTVATCEHCGGSGYCRNPDCQVCAGMLSLGSTSECGSCRGQLAYRWIGIDRRGSSRSGQTASMTRAELAGIVERRYRQGWERLTVTAPDGVTVGYIGPVQPGSMQRTWWAEGGAA